MAKTRRNRATKAEIEVGSIWEFRAQGGYKQIEMATLARHGDKAIISGKVPDYNDTFELLFCTGKGTGSKEWWHIDWFNDDRTSVWKEVI